jgi:hypothetical protein
MTMNGDIDGGSESSRVVVAATDCVMHSENKAQTDTHNRFNNG